jgi:hypothetical protein
MFRALRQLTKSSTTCQLVIIHAKGIPIWCPIKAHQNEKLEFNVIGVKCDIYWKKPIVAIGEHGFTLPWCFDANGKCDLEHINFFEIKTCPLNGHMPKFELKWLDVYVNTNSLFFFF